MNNQPFLDREFLIPTLLGGFSVIGIVFVLLIGRFLNSPAAIEVTASATPFEFVYLGTEPAIATPLMEESGIAPLTEEPTDDSSFNPPSINPTAIDAPPDNPPPIDALPTNAPQGPVTPTRLSISTPLILVSNTPFNNALRTSTPSRSPASTSTSGTAAAANTYDDTHSQLAYESENTPSTWNALTNVNGAYQGTLHVSTGIGDSVAFTFTGQQIHVFYQAGPSLGAVTITIDELGGPPLSQAQNETQIREWTSDLLTNETHSILIEHYGGGSVNIDSFVIQAATPTPTRTPTPTP